MREQIRSFNLFGLPDYPKRSPFNVGTATAPRYALTVDSLVNNSTADLIAAAKADPAARYALLKLNPFILTNASGLYSTINADHSLDLYDSAARTGSLTDEYLKDRAAFLYNKIQANNQDNDITADATTLATTWVAYTGSPQYFEDNGNYLPYKLYLGPSSSIVSQPLNSLTQIKFGSANTDILTGGGKWDKLYGRGGDDALSGGKGRMLSPEVVRLVRTAAGASRHLRLHRAPDNGNKTPLQEAA
ncbi:hypothetical protein [Thiobacter aerophilum]|uniref:Uncharacterized protein n=1 Tax=Thiobacter aerophilum TaxID=3121275 RepID=A0ABV0ED83_9BURK